MPPHTFTRLPRTVQGVSSGTNTPLAWLIDPGGAAPSGFPLRPIWARSWRGGDPVAKATQTQNQLGHNPKSGLYVQPHFPSVLECLP